MISIQFYATVRHFFDITEKLEFDCNDFTINDLLNKVEKSTGKKITSFLLQGNRIKSGFIILVNGEKKMFADEKLKDKDLVEVLSPAGGG